jgi:hypothetical protein
MLLTTAMIITKKGYMTLDEIRQGVMAYTLTARETKSEWLLFTTDKILRAFRILNKTISEVILKKWYDHVKTNLDCSQEQRVHIEKEIKQRKIDGPFLLPHEFLFLLCNSSDRLQTIERVYKPELHS